MIFSLFLNFFIIGLFSVGGGYAAIPLIESRIVHSMGWITLEEFANLMTIAEMTPGPIAVNCATFVGFRLAGATGAIFATLGDIAPSLIIVSLLSYAYRKYKSGSALSGILGTLRPVVVALIASAAVSLTRQAILMPGGIKIVETVLFLAAFFALRKVKTNPILTMLSCGVIRLVLYLIFKV